MENFILYEEIGRGVNSIVYKGRRKGTINFLAILCIEKVKRAPITNWVRLTHEIDHDNVVKFYEWYETSNHLWMIIELCTGGTLETVLIQDGFLPENVVRDFGKDIIKGLLHLHNLGIVFVNLCPKKVLLDGPGVLKITNFGIARLEDENLEEVFQQACAQHDPTEKNQDFKFFGLLEYQAPEIIKGSKPNYKSDVWSFGVLLYHLFTGSPPFKGENSADIVQQICHEQFEPPDLRRKQLLINNENIPPNISAETSSKQFLDLLKKILVKNPANRPSMEDIMNHPFWKNVFSKNDINNIRNESIISTSSSFMQQELNKDESNATSMNENTTPQRLNTAPERVDALDSTFTLSSRPHTAMNRSLDSRILNNNTSPLQLNDTFLKSKGPKMIGQSKAKTNDIGINNSSLQITENTKTLDMTVVKNKSEESVKDFIYHTSDSEISAIQDNPQITRVDQLRWDAKVIPFPTLPSVDGVSPEDLYNHMKLITQIIAKNPGNQPKLKLNVVTYLAHLCTLSSAVANFTINSQLLPTLANLVRSSSQNSFELCARSARAIGLAACCATELESGTKLNEVFSAFTDIIRENFKTTKIKLALLPPLGQLIYLVAEQEEGNIVGSVDENQLICQNWSVPSAAYMLIVRSLREGEDAVVQHIGCKNIENISSAVGSHGKRFMTSGGNGGEVIGTLLWSIAIRAPNEYLKQSAMSALCRLNKISGNGLVFQAVIDKVGLPQILTSLQRCSVRCVQSLVTVIVENLHSSSKGQANRLAAGKNLLPTLIKLMENPSTIVRAKVFLAVLELMKRNPDLLLVACQSRVVMYIERDIRRNLNDEKRESFAQTFPLHSEYMQSTLNLLVQYMTKQAPVITATCCDLLEETSNRKHPSTNHIKQLKTVLPNITSLTHMISSQVFRHTLVTSDFIFNLGKLLSHATKFLQTQATPSGVVAAIGEEISQEFIESVLTIVESLSQHPLIITQHQEASMESLVPRLVVLLGVYNKEGKAMCIKLLNEILGTLLHNKEIMEGGSGDNITLTSGDQGLCELIINNLIPEYQPILLGQEPLPVYGIHLLMTLVEHWPRKLSNSIQTNGLLPIILQILSEQRSNMLGSCAQSIIGLLIHIVINGTAVNMMDLYENGLIDILTSYTVEISCHYFEAQEADEREYLNLTSDAVLQLLTLLKVILTYVATDIKKTLQAKEKAETDATDIAEQLLVLNKPLTDLQGLCIQMLCMEEEIASVALSGFSLLVQLYGGDHPDTMAEENMDCLAEALEKSGPKQQKVILKAIKRVVGLHNNHAENIYGKDGKSGNLIKMLRLLISEGQRCADSTLAEIAQDVVGVIERTISS